MAATYTALITGVAHSTANKVYLQIFKDATPAVAVRIYRIWAINAQTAAVTGVLPIIIVASTSTAASAGSPSTVTLAKHDTTSTTYTSGAGGWTFNSGNTTNGTIVNTYRRLTYSSDEPATGTFKVDNFYAMPNTALLWDAGYGTSTLEPLTLPASTAGGIMIYSAGIASAAGTCDIAVEMTIS